MASSLGERVRLGCWKPLAFAVRGFQKSWVQVNSARCGAGRVPQRELHYAVFL